MTGSYPTIYCVLVKTMKKSMNLFTMALGQISLLRHANA